MAHQRVFEFPTSSELLLSVNALAVDKVSLLDSLTVALSLFSGAAPIATFATAEEALTFYNLWVERIEDAR